MKGNKLSFESENLVVDYISLNIQGWFDVKPIAKYLFQEFDFNSSIFSTGRVKTLNYDHRNMYSVSFRQQEYHPEFKSFWEGTQMIFSGEHAAEFYRLIKAQEFQWSILNLEKTSLGRFDIHYFLITESGNRNNLVQDFFLKSKDRAKAEGIAATSDSKLLKIGHRSSPNHYRVYLKEKILRKSVYDELVYGLEFELEMKGKTIKQFQNLLLSNSLEDMKNFEKHVSHHFYRYSLKRLDLSTHCTHWLVNSYRTKLREKESDHLLVTDYITKTPLKSFSEKESLFRLFQLLAFIRTNKVKPQKEEYVGKQTYYSLEFRLSDYLQFIEMTGIGGKGQSRRKKIKDDLMSLQGLNPLVKNFSRQEFQSYVIFPAIEVIKKGKFLVVEMSMAKQLYHYQYPYVLPRSFFRSKNKYDLQVKIEVLKTFCSKDIKKKFNVDSFLQQFSISNRKIKKIKNLLLKAVSDLDEFIEPTFEITKKNGSIFETKQLSLQSIKQARIISFNESINLLKLE